MGNGSLIDSSNNDITCNQMHSALGQMQGIANASDFEGMFDRFGMVEQLELVNDK